MTTTVVYSIFMQSSPILFMYTRLFCSNNVPEKGGGASAASFGKDQTVLSCTRAYIWLEGFWIICWKSKQHLDCG